MTDLTFKEGERPKMSAFNERFGILNGLYQYWWMVKPVTQATYEVSTTEKNVSVVGGNIVRKVVYYSDSVTADTASGRIVLSDPISTIYIDRDETEGPNELNTLKGKYFYVESSAIYLRTQTNAYYDGGTVYAPGKLVSYIPASYGEPSFLCSDDIDAYPNGEVQENQLYLFLGIPFENSRNPSRIAEGSYVGTGTYGESNPNTLTFEFEPKLVVITEHNSSIPDQAFFVKDSLKSRDTNSTASPSDITISWEGNIVNWYAGSKESQFNYGTYNYFAIG